MQLSRFGTGGNLTRAFQSLAKMERTVTTMDNDLIRRGDAITTLTIMADKMTADGAAVMDMAADILKNIPAVDAVQVLHGEWMLKPNIYGVAYCSVCDFELHTDDTNFCPNCGARMDGRRKEVTHETA